MQGCSDAGGLPNVYTAYQPVDDADVRRKFEEAWLTPLPGQPGLTVTEMVDGILTGQVKGWYVMGENPLMSEPNLRHAQHAVEQLEFFVAQDIFFNETNVYADVILPAASFAEKDGTFTNSDRRVQRVRAAPFPPLAGAWPTGRSSATWPGRCAQDDSAKSVRRRQFDPESPDRSHAEPAGPTRIHPTSGRRCGAVTPDFYGITYERLEREGGVHWPCPALDHPGTPYLFAEDFPQRPRQVLAGGLRHRERAARRRLSLHSQHRTGALSLARRHNDPGLGAGRDLARMYGGNASPTMRRGWGWRPVIGWMSASRRGTITARLLVTGRSPEGTVFIPFHFAEAAANVLTDNRLDERAKIPDYKVCGVRLARAAAPLDRPGAETSLTDRGTIKDPVPA